MEQLLSQAIAEIRQLRRENEILAAQVRIMDLFGATLFGTPFQPQRGIAEDVAWKLEQKRAELERNRDAKEGN